MTTLVCSICARHHHVLTCNNCAQDLLYPKRLETVALLAEKSWLEREIEKAVEGSSGKAEGLSAEAEQRLGRIEDVKERTRLLRERNLEEKEKVRQLKTQNEARRAQLVSQTEGLSERRAAGIDVLKKDIARTTSKWSAISSRTAEARVFLCREVALLYGLKSRKRKSKGTVEYLIGGVVIPSLSELNSASHMQISTVMGHLSHLLILASHYLSIKLPHEITLAGRVSPYTTIKSPRNSRPRPLNIQTDLRTLLRENLAEYTLFLEGYSMLCHNIAFLGYTQGITLTSLEEICLPGPSLYRILFVKDPTPGHQLKFGRCSHGTAYGFLGKADGQEVMKNWKIQLTEVYEAVRKVVHGDEINAEWDLVDVNEKDDDGWMKVRSVQR